MPTTLPTGLLICCWLILSEIWAHKKCRFPYTKFDGGRNFRDYFRIQLPPVPQSPKLHRKHTCTYICSLKPPPFNQLQKWGVEMISGNRDKPFTLLALFYKFPASSPICFYISFCNSRGDSPIFGFAYFSYLLSCLTPLTVSYETNILHSSIFTLSSLCRVIIGKESRRCHFRYHVQCTKNNPSCILFHLNFVMLSLQQVIVQLF